MLDVIDIDTQTVAGKLSYEGELISSPIVHGDKVSFAIQKRTSGRIGKRSVLGVIYELPTGNNLGTFRVEQDDPTAVYQRLMGRDKAREEREQHPSDYVHGTDKEDISHTKAHQRIEDIEDAEHEYRAEIDELKNDIASLQQSLNSVVSDIDAPVEREMSSSPLP